MHFGALVTVPFNLTHGLRLHSLLFLLFTTDTLDVSSLICVSQCLPCVLRDSMCERGDGLPLAAMRQRQTLGILLAPLRSLSPRLTRRRAPALRSLSHAVSGKTHCKRRQKAWRCLAPHASWPRRRPALGPGRRCRHGAVSALGDDRKQCFRRTLCRRMPERARLCRLDVWRMEDGVNER